MEKYFVPLNIYELLKDNGFDEPLLYCELQNLNIAAPLYHQVFDWLESKGFEIRNMWLTDPNRIQVDLLVNGWDKFTSVLQISDMDRYVIRGKAWNDAIITALKLINNNEINNNATERTGEGKED